MGRTACTEPQCLYNGAPYLTTMVQLTLLQWCTLPYYNGEPYLETYLTTMVKFTLLQWCTLPY